MAQSRLEKIGTIFTRVQGLLRGGAMKVEDKPIWYDVYAAFPPRAEPRFDKKAPNIPIRNIFYAEDVARAKLHKQNKPNETVNLLDHRRTTQSQQFIQIYDNLKSQGALDDERIYETALDLLAEQRQQLRTEAGISSTDHSVDVEPQVGNLLSDFKEAGEQQQQSAEGKPHIKAKKEVTGINIDSLFKD